MPPYTCYVLESLTRQLIASRDLAEEQIRFAVDALADDSVPVSTKADFLTALARKGERPEEIVAFAWALRSRSVRPQLDAAHRARVILDVVGTGGDRLSTFNISTTVALICAAAGILVAKHGNRASTSLVGSADVMDALGIPFDLGPAENVERLRQHGFAYFFAPKYHPAFRHIAPARKLCAERGEATIFNFLGPLLNPAAPNAMLVGVPRPELCESLAQVLQSLGVTRGMVVCGAAPDETGQTRYLDELSPLGLSTAAEFHPGRALAVSQLSPQGFPVKPARLSDLRGGDREVNAAIIRKVLSGEDRGPRRDAVLLNAGAALFIGGAAGTMLEGWELAAELIDSGRASAKFKVLLRHSATA